MYLQANFQLDPIGPSPPTTTRGTACADDADMAISIPLHQHTPLKSGATD